MEISDFRVVSLQSVGVAVMFASPPGIDFGCDIDCEMGNQESRSSHCHRDLVPEFFDPLNRNPSPSPRSMGTGPKVRR